MRKQDTPPVRLERCSPQKQILSILCPTKFLSTLRMAHRYRQAEPPAVIHAALAEAKERSWRMNVAVVDSGGNLVAF